MSECACGIAIKLFYNPFLVPETTFGSIGHNMSQFSVWPVVYCDDLVAVISCEVLKGAFELDMVHPVIATEHQGIRLVVFGDHDLV